MSYNGKATIELVVERFQEIDGSWRKSQPGDDPEKIQEIELEVKGRSYYMEGKTSGLPENCYPDEGETEIIEVTYKGKPFTDPLTSEETEQAQELICNAVQEDDGPDPDEYDDYEYDDRDQEFYYDES